VVLLVVHGVARGGADGRKACDEKNKKICNDYSLHGGGQLVVMLAARGRAISGETLNEVVGGCRGRGHGGRREKKR